MIDIKIRRSNDSKRKIITITIRMVVVIAIMKERRIGAPVADNSGGNNIGSGGKKRQEY